jgi:hypothetical protein
MFDPWVVNFFQRLRHAQWPPGQRHAEKPLIIARIWPIAAVTPSSRAQRGDPALVNTR